MVASNENNRPTIAQILNDPWFAEIRNLSNDQQAQLDNQIHNEFVARENQINQQNQEIQPNQQNQQNQPNQQNQQNQLNQPNQQNQQNQQN